MKIFIDRNVFHFLIINDKPETQKHKEFGGIGLVNAKKRLQLLYPEKHTLSIEDGEKTFTVELMINLS